MLYKTEKWKAGSTVIEVLIATTIVAFALTALAMLMTNNVKNSAEADYREAAAGLAQDTMEKIRQRKTTVAWSTFIATPYPLPVTITGCNTSTTKYNTTFYTGCTLPPVGAPSEFTITVIVCWPGTTTGCTAGAKTTTVVQRFFNY